MEALPRGRLAELGSNPTVVSERIKPVSFRPEGGISVSATQSEMSRTARHNRQARAELEDKIPSTPLNFFPASCTICYAGNGSRQGYEKIPASHIP